MPTTTDPTYVEAKLRVKGPGTVGCWWWQQHYYGANGQQVESKISRNSQLRASSKTENDIQHICQ